MFTAAVRPLRIGAVSYLNSKPLIEGLGLLAPEVELVLDYPSRLADELAAGRLDVALVPSIECLRHPEYKIVSDACVATRGPVLSVKLYSRVPMSEICSLALDDGSRTSAVLTRIMLAERYGVFPSIQPLTFGQSAGDTEADAVLLIGDRAMHEPTVHYAATWDLGEEWLNWSGLPFVFAHWAARSETALGGLAETLSRIRDRGVERVAEIARREAPKLEIPVQRAIDYLTRNLHYTLGSAERNGLKLFYELATKLELVSISTQPKSTKSLTWNIV